VLGARLISHHKKLHSFAIVVGFAAYQK